MKKVITLVVTGFLLVGAFGCEEATKNTSEMPKNTNETVQTSDKTTKSIPKTTAIPTPTTDIKAKPEIQKTPLAKLESDLKTAVISKLTAGLPGNKLEVQNQDGEIIIKGIASSQQELQKAEQLVKEVKGVKSVTIEAQVKSPKKS
jgi:hypothetical protein